MDRWALAMERARVRVARRASAALTAGANGAEGAPAGWACELKLAQQTDLSEPLARVNTEPAAKLNPDWNEKKAWDGFVEFYTKV